MNTYIKIGNHFKKVKKNLVNWIKQFLQHRPKCNFIICGDFNNHKNPVEFLYDSNKKEKSTFRHKNKHRTKEFINDWVLYNKQNLITDFKTDFFEG